LILVGLGAFLLIGALLLRFYAYPTLAVAPQDQNSVSRLVGPNATVFDTATLSEITTDLVTTARTSGDVPAADKAGDNTLVWVNTSSTKSSDGVVRSRSIDRVAFDATSGEAVNCCGEYYETVDGEPNPIEHKGLVFKFPFDTQKKTYQWWDSSLERAVPIDYKGVSKVEGVTVYKFEHTIEPTSVGTVDVPASVLGEDQEGNLTADRMYSNTRTLWVEPNTGVVIKRLEAQDNTLAYQGEDRVTTTKVTTQYDDATVKDNADTYGPKGEQLALVHGLLPITFGVLGLLLLVGGIVLTTRRRPAHV
jgi:hypothetical protein